MQLQALLADSWRQLRRERAAWAAGLFGVAGNLLLGLWLRQAARPELWREPLRLWWERQQIPVAQLLFWGGGALLLFLLAWLLALVGEGTLIAIAAGKERPWRQARRWLLRLVVIDTLVFLPLLVVLMTALVVLVALLTGSTLAALESADPRAALLGGGSLALLCVTPLMLLLIPLALLTLVVRLLAFRAATLAERGPRPPCAGPGPWSGCAGQRRLAALLLWGIAYTALRWRAVFLTANLVIALPGVAASRFARPHLLLQLLLALVNGRRARPLCLSWPRLDACLPADGSAGERLMRAVGVDTGGTFTDFVWLQDGRLQIHKQLSTPDDPSRTVLDGLARLGAAPKAPVVHGSTVATNALLERRGARTALVTTAGFAEVREIGRQNRPELYALVPQKPPPLVPRPWRLEVDGG